VRAFCAVFILDHEGAHFGLNREKKNGLKRRKMVLRKREKWRQIKVGCRPRSESSAKRVFGIWGWRNAKYKFAADSIHHPIETV
jgi:hypothetical protein